MASIPPSYATQLMNKHKNDGQASSDLAPSPTRFPEEPVSALSSQLQTTLIPTSFASQNIDMSDSQASSRTKTGDQSESGTMSTMLSSSCSQKNEHSVNKRNDAQASSSIEIGEQSGAGLPSQHPIKRARATKGLQHLQPQFGGMAFSAAGIGEQFGSGLSILSNNLQENHQRLKKRKQDDDQAPSGTESGERTESGLSSQHPTKRVRVNHTRGLNTQNQRPRRKPQHQASVPNLPISSPSTAPADVVPDAPPSDTALPVEVMAGITGKELAIFYPNHCIHWPAIAARVMAEFGAVSDIAQEIYEHRRGWCETGEIMVADFAAKMRPLVESSCRLFFDSDHNWKTSDLRNDIQRYQNYRWEPAIPEWVSSTPLKDPWPLTKVRENVSNMILDSGAKFSAFLGGVVNGRIPDVVMFVVSPTVRHHMNPPALPHDWDPCESFKAGASANDVAQPADAPSQNTTKKKGPKRAGRLNEIKAANCTRESIPLQIRDDPNEIIKNYPERVAGELLLWLLSNTGGEMKQVTVLEKLNASLKERCEMEPLGPPHKDIERSTITQRVRQQLRRRARLEGVSYQEAHNTFEALECYRDNGNRAVRKLPSKYRRKHPRHRKKTGQQGDANNEAGDAPALTQPESFQQSTVNSQHGNGSQQNNLSPFINSDFAGHPPIAASWEAITPREVAEVETPDILNTGNSLHDLSPRVDSNQQDFAAQFGANPSGHSSNGFFNEAGSNASFGSYSHNDVGGNAPGGFESEGLATTNSQPCAHNNTQGVIDPELFSPHGHSPAHHAGYFSPYGHAPAPHAGNLPPYWHVPVHDDDEEL